MPENGSSLGKWQGLRCLAPEVVCDHRVTRVHLSHSNPCLPAKLISKAYPSLPSRNARSARAVCDIGRNRKSRNELRIDTATRDEGNSSNPACRH